MTDAEIKQRLGVKIDLLGLSLDQNRFAKWVIDRVAPEVQKLMKEGKKEKNEN